MTRRLNALQELQDADLLTSKFSSWVFTGVATATAAYGIFTFQSCVGIALESGLTKFALLLTEDGGQY